MRVNYRISHRNAKDLWPYKVTDVRVHSAANSIQIAMDLNVAR
jgi:hypothetical protein